MAAILSREWWDEHRPSQWKNTGIGDLLGTYQKATHDLNASGFAFDARTNWAQANRDNPKGVKAARQAKQAATDAYSKLDQLMTGDSAHADPVKPLLKELGKAKDQLKYVQ